MSNALKAQLLAAIDTTFIKVLEDELFGYADVTPIQMLTHLRTTYVGLKVEERGTIRESLRATWNPDDPIEDIWTRTSDVVRALQDSEPVPASAIVRDQLSVFEKTGVFPRACEAWREKELVEQTVANLQEHFTRYNEERMRVLTAKQAGYHAPASPSANLAANTTSPSANIATNTASTPDTPHVVMGNGVKMFYCWTHGLGTNPKHSSSTCKKKADGHKNEATADKMLDSNDRIMKPFVRAPRAANP